MHATSVCVLSISEKSRMEVNNREIKSKTVVSLLDIQKCHCMKDDAMSFILSAYVFAAVVKALRCGIQGLSSIRHAFHVFFLS